MRVLLDGNVQLTGDGDDVEVGRSVPKERLEAEFARIQGLDDDVIEAMCSIIGAKDVSDVVRKISRFMLANSNPGLMLGRTFETEGPGGFEAFCLRLSSYRELLARIEQGVIARDAVNEVLSEQKARLVETMRPLLDEFEDSEHVWMRIDADVYDDDDEIDLGELRAEIDRLLHHLEVDPQRIHVSLVPAGKNPPTDRRTPEETLFADLLFLLQRHGERIDGKPTRRVLTVVVNVLDQLRQRGNLPKSDPSDVTFLARLIAALDQLRGRATAPFLLALVDSIRGQLLNEELLDTTLDSDSDSDDDDDAPDGGVPPDSNGETPNDNGISGSGVCRCPAGTYQQIAPGRRAPRYWHGGRAGHDLSRPSARVVASSNDIYARLRGRFAGSMQEQFVVLALDARNVVTETFEVARGSVTHVEVHPREVFRPLIRQAAVAAVVAHNHPSGDPRPSVQDLALTDRLRAVGNLIGIPVLDHLIIGEDSYVSLVTESR